MILLGIASYLLINSLLIVIRLRHEAASLFLAATSIFLSISLLSKTILFDSLILEISTLLIWPSFFLYLISHQREFVFKRSLLFHLIFPVGWLMIYFTRSISEVEGVFDFVYLLATVGYGWWSIYETSKLKKVTYWDANYIDSLFVGLIVVISSRIILPIFLQNVESYMLYFHLILSAYFILLSSFYIKIPKKNLEEQLAAIQIDVAINYEEELKRKLKNAMLREKVFLNPDLTLNDLASKLDIKSTELSNFINNNLGKNYNDFVNEYRVEEFKQLMTTPTTDAKATIIELAYDAGFNSKASFNRIFKQFTGMTPTQFKKSNQD
ncbi:helix-turn-helix domain-containing protein [Chondrinema litorale]|uniref:helix-turn-helix domain-containing protein n=1 Tax=Chondrinema litorale TaxID=2994555 RepID=UPI002542FA09|nr:helix-turn-helix domain-containing protein [Chondrinema litorale]UZR97717.1 helix-turn-helix domain-containing protein [Chondrinema litorale]